MEKLNYKNIEEISKEIDAKASKNFITGISVINSTDILISFAFYKTEKLFISLNHEYPFVCLVNYKNSIPTTLGNTNTFLRKYVKDAYLDKVEFVDGDRVIVLKLKKSDEFYKKFSFTIYLELFSHRSNMIIVDENNKIVFAMHYTTINNSRPVINGIIYTPVKPIKSKCCENEFSLDKFKKDCLKKINDSLIKKETEQFMPLHSFIKSKIKSISKKITIQKNDLEKAKSYKEDQKIADELSAFYYDENQLKSYINSSKINYNSENSLAENIANYYKLAKKKKRTIEMTEIEIKKSYNELEQFENILNTWPFLTYDELQELTSKYIKNKPAKSKQNNSVIDLPSYITLGNTKIGFGKTAKQNEILTFKIAKKSYYYFHILNYSGSHVVVFSNNPTNDEILTACEMAILLSGKECGEVSMSEIKDVKKGQFIGQVLLGKYQSFNITKIRENTKNLIKSSLKFR
ncbi:MAG: NFACT family protein [Bacilli bacterium]|nr:NFACT family protein [Bacilli bacterium]